LAGITAEFVVSRRVPQEWVSVVLKDSASGQPPP
jgi:hypothetical protein